MRDLQFLQKICTIFFKTSYQSAATKNKFSGRYFLDYKQNIAYRLVYFTVMGIIFSKLSIMLQLQRANLSIDIFLDYEQQSSIVPSACFTVMGIICSKLLLNCAYKEQIYRLIFSRL